MQDPDNQSFKCALQNTFAVACHVHVRVVHAKPSGVLLAWRIHTHTNKHMHTNIQLAIISPISSAAPACRTLQQCQHLYDFTIATLWRQAVTVMPPLLSRVAALFVAKDNSFVAIIAAGACLCYRSPQYRRCRKSHFCTCRCSLFAQTVAASLTTIICTAARHQPTLLRPTTTVAKREMSGARLWHTIQNVKKYFAVGENKKCVYRKIVSWKNPFVSL